MIITPTFHRLSPHRFTPSQLGGFARTLALALVSLAGLSGLASAATHELAPAAAPWTPTTLRTTLAALPQGHAQAGKKVHDELFCASCHGANGVAPTQNWPHLAGQKAAYTAKMMLDYQDARRLEGKRAELMHDIAVMLSPQQIADVAAFYEAQTPAVGDGTPRPNITLGAQDVGAATLVRKGDPARLITPCASCHGVAGQGGKREASALAGQNPLYFVRTMLDFQNGTRHNDSVKGMRSFAKKLSRSEIGALATYYADLPAGQAK